MQKYSSSYCFSPNNSNRNFSGFNSMIVFSPKNKPKQPLYSQKKIYERVISSKTFTFKSQSTKTPGFLKGSEKFIFRSPQKKSIQTESTKNPSSDWKSSFNYTFKRKQYTSIKQISIKEEKELRDSDSTKCQSTKASQFTKIQISDFKKLQRIGNGKYGSVYMVKHIKTGFIAALKIIRKIDIDCLEKQDKQKMINQIIRQIKIQSFLNHPNLVKLYTYFSDESNIYLLMELGCDGQLYDLMKKKSKLREDSVSIITRQVLEGLSYMHKNQVIHRDIKPENIVLIHGLAKICDFGWSVYCSKSLRSTLCGTPLYLSPQILKGSMYNQKIDTWAIGTLAYELFTSDNPFNIKKKEDLSKIITDDFVMRTGSLELRNFLGQILKKDPSRRPDAQKIKHHDFIKKYQDIDTSQQISALTYRKQINIHQSCFK